MNAWIFYAGAFVSSALYAALLERLDKRLEPDWIWVEVFLGVVLTGSWVGARMRWGTLPKLPAVDLIWWVCWQWIFFFIATGAPVIAWQIWQMRKRLLDALYA